MRAFLSRLCVALFLTLCLTPLSAGAQAPSPEELQTLRYEDTTARADFSLGNTRVVRLAAIRPEEK